MPQAWCIIRTMPRILSLGYHIKSAGYVGLTKMLRFQQSIGSMLNQEMVPKIIHGYVIGAGRLAAAARPTGIATACLEIALEWTKSRQIAGKSVKGEVLFRVNSS